MLNSKLFALCKWDFISIQEAESFNPHSPGNVINYVKMPDISLDSLKPTNEPNLAYPKLQEVGQLEVKDNAFGLFSWTPVDKNDLSMILEYKTEINLYTQHIPENTEKVVFITNTVKEFFQESTFRIGFCCLGGFNDSKFRIAFGKTSRAAKAFYADFSLNPDSYYQHQHSPKLLRECIYAVLRDVLLVYQKTMGE